VEPVNANEMKHAASLAEWKQRIMDCRASGLPVKAWCTQNSYNASTYYRWERELFGKMKKPATTTELVIRSESMLATTGPEMVELPVSVGEKTATAKEEPVFCPVAVVKVGELELALTNAVSPKLMKHLRKLMPYAE